LWGVNVGDYCPAYEGDGTENDGDRRYQKVTLKVEYDEERNDGSMVATMALVQEDTNGENDNYNTFDVEVCDGLESILTPEDPPHKCSFGHRMDGGTNCYGKIEMDFYAASSACERRGGHLLRIDSQKELDELADLFGSQSLGIGLHLGDSLQEMEWDGYPGCKVERSYFSGFLMPAQNNQKACFRVDRLNSSPRLIAADCEVTRNWICEARRPSETEQDKATCASDDILSGPGGDLLRDEGGFCLWYLADRVLTLPDDESGGFRNTDISSNLAYSQETITRKYYEIFGRLVETETFRGVYENEANWNDLILQKMGRNSTEKIVLDKHETDDFHCHMSPTNFGISRVYLQQHMLERVYPGAFAKHCFCGYKYMGHLVTRCDCTKNGVRNNNCQKEHRPMIYEATYKETGEYVYCNNNQCDNASP